MAFHTSGGRVAERKPIPHAQVVRAVMDAGDLAELNRVDDQAHVTVPGEPDAVMLEGHFGAPRSGLMAAQVQNGGQPPDGPFGNVEVSRYVEARQAFEDNIFHAISVAFELAGWAPAGRPPPPA